VHNISFFSLFYADFALVEKVEVWLCGRQQVCHTSTSTVEPSVADSSPYAKTAYAQDNSRTTQGFSAAFCAVLERWF
jgi:hypothetical protein